jgi:hypothetical protein
MPLIGAGKLDRMLFDVTSLVAFNYDDAKSGTLPLIVTHHAGYAAAVAPIAGAAIARRFQSVHGEAVGVSKRDLGGWWDSLSPHTSTTPGAAAKPSNVLPQLDSSIEKIWLDRMLQTLLDRSRCVAANDDGAVRAAPQ